MRQILAGDKKKLRNRNVIHFEVPDYDELAVKNIWPIVRENPDLMEYFPDLKEGDYPEKEFLYGVLGTIREVETRNLFAEATRNRAVEEQTNHEDLVELDAEMREEIEGLLNLRTTKGRANFLLKKSAVHKRQRKPNRKYIADMSPFQQAVHHQDASPDRKKANTSEEKKEEDMDKIHF